MVIGFASKYQNKSNNLKARGNLLIDKSMPLNCGFRSIISPHTEPESFGWNKFKSVRGVFLWLTGESYNFMSVASDLNLNGNSFIDLLIESYERNLLKEFLYSIDGVFSSVLYDHSKNKVILFTDRFGMKSIYYTFENGALVWSSKISELIKINHVNKEIDSFAPKVYLNIGHLLDDRTWFEKIKLIKPASIIEYNIDNGDFYYSHYWKWSSIKKNDIPFNDAVNKLGELFLSSVEKRFDPSKKIGLGLSGGLDSRAIFSAINELYPTYKGYCYTFGEEGTKEVNISKKVSELSNWSHHLINISVPNFQERIKHVWGMDGFQSIYHMHTVSINETISRHISINMRGIWGDTLLHPTYLKNKKTHNTRITESLAREIFKTDYIDNAYESTFYDINSCGPYFQDNRTRRFTNLGPESSEMHFLNRFPFVDNDLVDFIYSIPDSYKAGSRIYICMLLKFFPKFFENIPWEKTGMSISDSLKMPTRTLKIKRFLKKYFPSRPKKIELKPISSELLELYNEAKKNKLLISLLDDDYLLEYLSPKLDTNKSIDTACRLITMSVYFNECRNREYIRF